MGNIIRGQGICTWVNLSRPFLFNLLVGWWTEMLILSKYWLKNSFQLRGVGQMVSSELIVLFSGVDLARIKTQKYWVHIYQHELDTRMYAKRYVAANYLFAKKRRRNLYTSYSACYYLRRQRFWKRFRRRNYHLQLQTTQADLLLHKQPSRCRFSRWGPLQSVLHRIFSRPSLAAVFRLV